MSIANEIIARFSAVFGEPRTDNPDLFLREFSRCMDGYDEAALRIAADRLIAKSTFWPKPAELLGEAKTVLSERRRFGPRKNEDFPSIERTPEQIAMAEELVENFKRFLAEKTTGKREQDATDWTRGQRQGFEAMQRNSPNPGLHMTEEGLMQLSEISRRQTGEHNE